MNDVLFATHGFVVNVVICLQCVFYERGDQKITDVAKAILIGIYSPAFVLTLLFMWSGVDKYYYISFFSYCKLLLTLCKYIPQVSSPSIGRILSIHVDLFKMMKFIFSILGLL